MPTATITPPTISKGGIISQDADDGQDYPHHEEDSHDRLQQRIIYLKDSLVGPCLWPG